MSGTFMGPQQMHVQKPVRLILRLSPLSNSFVPAQLQRLLMPYLTPTSAISTLQVHLRFARMGALGAVIHGPWVGVLSSRFPGATPKAVQKVIVDGCSTDPSSAASSPHSLFTGVTADAGRSSTMMRSYYLNGITHGSWPGSSCLSALSGAC
jgi:hypothetical protein